MCNYFRLDLKKQNFLPDQGQLLWTWTKGGFRGPRCSSPEVIESCPEKKMNFWLDRGFRKSALTKWTSTLEYRYLNCYIETPFSDSLFKQILSESVRMPRPQCTHQIRWRKFLDQKTIYTKSEKTNSLILWHRKFTLKRVQSEPNFHNYKVGSLYRTVLSG